MNKRIEITPGKPIVAKLQEIIPGINLGKINTQFENPETNPLEVRIEHFIRPIYRSKKCDELFSSFKNQVVIDLFSGPNLHAYREAANAEARGYIAVDLYNENAIKMLDKDEFVEDIIKTYNLNKFIPATFRKEDALTFLKRIPSDSTSIFISGAGFCFFNNGEYLQDLKKEIVRVLHPEGAYIGNCTEVIPRGLNLTYGELGTMDTFRLSKKHKVN